MKNTFARCGLACTGCRFADCKGCTEIEKPFWGECIIKKCCEDKNLTNCGECEDFPCEDLVAFSYDENEGDNGRRIENCRRCKNGDD